MLVNEGMGQKTECTVGIMEMNLDPVDMIESPYVILGVLFMKKYYIVFDRDTDQVGIADAAPDFRED